ncbi:MAG: Error-prone repair homolog of DNA polymerase III alpha subunit [uncultured Frankineae bacterium]|uniref:DNA polymerase III subunit alpha n=1 Tax=uncultured Frankineae bacterium TaxID=437475 RepID=A0A6J4L7S8_9ACTN|nr:MAG: Error-prone repair homolog of DNA polymerase III alpha subunit [uncultured Frankineae bacterium]
MLPPTGPGSPGPDPFVHLHVASGYSLRHGASSPRALVERAAEHGMDTLALTDRDGAYGVVKFAKACAAAGVRPVFGVDLAVAPVLLDPSGGRAGAGSRSRSGAGSGAPGAGRSASGAGRSSPARGGAFLDQDPDRGVEALPRVVLLARDGRGWAALCRLVSATHLAGERGAPVSTLDLVAEHAGGAAQAGALAVLLGPASELGRAVTARRDDLARAHLSRWRDVLGRDGVVVEVVCHRGPGDVGRAARMLGFATEQHCSAVLTNVVRYADRADAPTADVLDAARRLVALDLRHVDRRNAEAALLPGKSMAEVAAQVARAAGSTDEGRRLLARTRFEADRCAVDPRRDLGIGEVHFPELETGGGEPLAVLRERCEAGFGRRAMARDAGTVARLEDELGVISGLGYPSYFLTVADVVDLIKGMGVRVAARGSGAGSLVTYLLGISDVDPIRYGLLMERFLSPLRHQLPDIDVDVESARRMEVYEQILARYGGERCTCVSMMDTYRARHGIRDVGAALGLPPGEVDALAKAFPHIRASQVRAAMRDLPELRASGLAKGENAGRIDLLLRLVERLDGLPRHVALHPCGVLLSDTTLLDRTPVESSWLGLPMSQFDKDDVEELGLLKLDVLGIRMQSAMQHAIGEIARVDGVQVDVDAAARDDPDTFALVQSTKTLGCFQIESPGQRELVGKFAPETFEDLIVDISLFRPGPVKSDMVRPFLEARQGWKDADLLHPDLEPVLAQTSGVVVFHEQVLQIVSTMTGCSLAEADEVRRALGDPEGQPEVQAWFVPCALAAGYELGVVERVWEVLKAFGSFGFCKAHAAAFALPTYQSAWLKAHHPAAFLAGVLTHDPGMYPKRLILDDARQFGIAVLSLDVNLSDAAYRVERVGVLDEPPPAVLDQVGSPAAPPEAVADLDGWLRDGPGVLGGVSGPRSAPSDPRLPDGRGYGIRIGLAEVKGMSEAETARIVAGRPYASLSDFWHRAAVSRPVVERLVVAGAFDSIYGLGSTVPVRRRGQVTRRDLLLQVAELDRWSRSTAAAARKAGPRRRSAGTGRGRATTPLPTSLTDPATSDRGAAASPIVVLDDVRARQARQSQAPATPEPVDVQLALDLGDAPEQTVSSGLPEMSRAERVRAELDVLGLDVSSHVMDAYAPFLDELGTTRAQDLLGCRSRQEVLVAGVKVATQTPPIRSGRRVIFVTLDDATGPLDATFFEDAQVGYATTVFHSWLLVVQGLVRRTGPRGVSMQAVGCWELPALHSAWLEGGLEAVWALMATPALVTDAAVQGAAASRSSRPVMTSPPLVGGGAGHSGVGGAVHVYATGFRASPYADIKPAGDGTGTSRGRATPAAPRKLWHASPGSSGQ